MMTIVYIAKAVPMSDTLNLIAYGIAWLVVGWHIVAIAAGAAIMTWEHFMRPPAPTAEEISLAADSYEARHGDAALRQIGEDMYEERSTTGSSQCHRFLREVSGELVKRRMARPGAAAARFQTEPDQGIFRADNSIAGAYAQAPREPWPRRGVRVR